ncbi:MAG: BatA domain-containing protein [Planctomycetes bacterium]|nr:BatA domain-containing protein [Planctomycetota bacterium]
MDLLHPLLLRWGLALAAIPVVLHLLMRAKPRKLLFPALRLIQARRKTNVRRLRLRHLWLLFLRVAVIAAIVMALARPRLPPANYSLTSGEAIRLAVVVLAVIAGYLALLTRWRRQRLPNHVLAYRRTMLRGGTGVAAVVLLLLLVGWPYQRRIAAQIDAPTAETVKQLPLAAVFLFDTSLSMEYRHESRTRLEQAREHALSHLGNLPPQSRIAVADTASADPILFQSDLSGAAARIRLLETRALSQTLDSRLRDALRAHEDDAAEVLAAQDELPEDERSDGYLRGVFIFTDLASSAWRDSAASLIGRELERLKRVNVYLVDVGVEDPQNVGVTAVRLSQESLPQGGDLVVAADVEAIGVEAGERLVELYAGATSEDLTKRDQKTVPIAETAQRAEFLVRGLSGPFAHGEVRLPARDPYPADNVRFFTVAVHPPPEILIVAENAERAAYFQLALSPPGLEGRQRYRTTFLSAAQFAAANDLERFDVVCLIDVAAPADETWRRLGDYVKRGGGLLVVTGPLTDPAAYIGETPKTFLPGELMARRHFDPPETLDLQDLSHPVLRKFAELNDVGLLDSVDVHWCWRARPLEGDSRAGGNPAEGLVLVRYTDGITPALLERGWGAGRVMLLTTAVDLRGWSDLPRAWWAFPALCDQTMQYLSGRRNLRLNYQVGDPVEIALEGPSAFRRYLIRKPAGAAGVGAQLSGEIEAGAETLVRRDTEHPGHYTILANEGSIPFRAGFSANAPAAESDFTRLAPRQLDELLGKDRYRLARNPEDLELILDEDLAGRRQEIFPQVIFLVVLAFCAECLIANRFYESDQAPEHV